MKHWIALVAIVALLLLFAIYQTANDERADQPAMGISEYLGDAESDSFARAARPRVFTFPEDHGPHPDYKNEWWYFTGNLADENGRRFGYELTFFRFGLKPGKPSRKSDWATHHAYMAHFAITDVEEEKFYAWERFNRDAIELAGARVYPFRVWLDNWSVSGESVDNPSCRGCLSIQLQARQNETRIDLTLDSIKPVVLQGDNGLSRKNSTPGNASYYYSLTRLATKGELTIDGRRFNVSGSSWLDREWSTSVLDRNQSGWDWFALQLSDNREIMFYRLRHKDGSDEVFNKGVFVAEDGQAQMLHAQDVELEELDTWRSKQSGIRYPSKWRLSVPAKDIELTIEPLLNNQELNLAFRYWEGASVVTGTIGKRKTQGYGYVELAGYAASN